MINKYKYFVYFILISVTIVASGQSMQDLKKMREDYEKFQKGQSQDDLNASPLNTQTIDDFEDFPQKFSMTPYTASPNTELEEDKYNNHFGYNFFTKRDSVPFWENLPTPSNYLLGPGDELIISIWGETQLRQTYLISREGKIYDSKVGLLLLTSKDISSARKYIKEQFARVYATLDGEKPSSYIDVSLGKLKSINVNFVGELNYPGVYPIHPFSTVITGLIQTGGVDTTGSLRKIEIKRDGKLVSTVDLYEYFIKGITSSAIQLKDQDVVIVPPRNSVIFIDSAVVRPGKYESIPNETVYDLLNYAGGPLYNADNLVAVRQINENKNRIKGSIYNTFYVNYENTKIIPVLAGDKIFMRTLYEDIHEVEIIGQVKSPGKYHYFEGLSLQQLLKFGGGFNDSTFLKSIYKNQAEIIRRNPKNRYEEVISINLNKVIYDKSEPILLKNLDKIVIHANLNFFERENINISGEVNIPGDYPLVKDNESLESLINRAGGLTGKALENGISIYRKNKYFEKKIELENNQMYLEDKDNPNFNEEKKAEQNNKETRVRVAWENTNITLMAGDSVVVKEKTATIYVTGAVYNPGILEYRDRKSLRSYINSAGGVTNLGNEKGIIVLYPSGLVRPKRWFFSPKIVEGSTIIVNTKVPEQPFDITQFATNWTSILSSMITAIVLSKQI